MENIGRVNELDGAEELVSHREHMVHPNILLFAGHNFPEVTVHNLHYYEQAQFTIVVLWWGYPQVEELCRVSIVFQLSELFQELDLSEDLSEHILTLAGVIDILNGN